MFIVEYLCDVEVALKGPETVDSWRDNVMKYWGWDGKKIDVALGMDMEEAWEQRLLSS